MPGIRLEIPSFNGGVSRQPPAHRHTNQVEESDNTTHSLVRGAEKRPGSEVVGWNGTASTTGNADTSLALVEPALSDYWHWIDRDSSEQYVLRIVPQATADDDKLQLFKLSTGARVSITVGSAFATYLAENSATGADIHAITVADTTLIVNKTVVTATTATTKNYQYSGTAVRDSGNAHHVDSWSDFDFPPLASDEYWYARDDDLGHPAGFYKSQNHTGTGPFYVRVQTEDANTEIDATTMPIRLFNNGGDSFTVNSPTWEPRYSGDAITNPAPSFIGLPITDMCFYRNRLWFGADEQLVGSRSGDFFNFWLDSYTIVSDVDPIDVALSSNKITPISHLAPFEKALVIFTSGGLQFELRSLESLTPTTATIMPTTSYRTGDVRPVTGRSQLYAVTDQATAETRVMEYAYSVGSASNIAHDISAHCAGFLPSGPLDMAISENTDQLFLLTGDTNALYVYHTAFEGRDRVQSAWSKWEFDENQSTATKVDTIVTCRVFGDYLYYVWKKDTANKHYMSRIPVVDPPSDTNADGTWDFNVRLDRKIFVQPTYDSTTNTTTWTLPYWDDQIDTVVLTPAWSADNRDGDVVNITNDSTGATTNLTASGNYATLVDTTATTSLVGKSYTHGVTVSELFARDQDDNTQQGILQLKHMTSRHRNSGPYDVIVTPEGRSAQTHRFVGRRMGLFNVGADPLETSGEFSHKVMASAQGVTIRYENSSHYPSSWTTAAIKATFAPARISAAKT